MFTTPQLRFRLRFVETPDPNEGGEKKIESKDGDLGFPANTPVVEMTAEQQAAYWKHQSRKHEKNRKPTDYDTTLADAEKWRQAQEAKQTPDEKSLSEAKAKGRAEATSTLLHDAVRAELKAARPHMTTEELNEFLEDVALDRFLSADGRLDAERVSRLADKLAAPATDDKSGEQLNGGQLLGRVLGGTTPPPKGNELGVDHYRQQEAARYKTNQ